MSNEWCIQKETEREWFLGCHGICGWIKSSGMDENDVELFVRDRNARECTIIIAPVYE